MTPTAANALVISLDATLRRIGTVFGLPETLRGFPMPTATTTAYGYRFTGGGVIAGRALN